MPVTNLTREEFSVQEGDERETIEVFYPVSSSPLALGLLVDLSNSLRLYKLSGAMRIMQNFVQRTLRAGDQAFVAAFSDELHERAGPTTNVAEIEQTIASIGLRRSKGATALYGTVQWSCKEQLSRIQARRVLVVLTDGIETMNPDSLQETLEVAQRTDTIVYLVLIEGSSMLTGREGRTLRQTQRLSQETGGRVIEVRNEKKLQEAFDQISEELRSQYTLGYYPTNKARDGKFRKIKIETTRKGLKVLVRKGYYAPRH
jgi:VWFA-related protein